MLREVFFHAIDEGQGGALPHITAVGQRVRKLMTGIKTEPEIVAALVRTVGKLGCRSLWQEVARLADCGCDAVLFDDEQGVLRAAKSLTTRHDRRARHWGRRYGDQRGERTGFRWRPPGASAKY